MFLGNFTGIYNVLSLRFRYGCDELLINFPVFMSKPFSYSTKISEFCILKSDFGFSGEIRKLVSLFSQPSLFFKILIVGSISIRIEFSKEIDS